MTIAKTQSILSRSCGGFDLRRPVVWACAVLCLLTVRATDGHDNVPPRLGDNGSGDLVGSGIPALLPARDGPDIRIDIPPGELGTGALGKGDLPPIDRETKSGIGSWMEPSNASSTLRTMALFSIISLAPAIALMTTSYVRVAIVLTLLRQGLGAQGLPSNQMISALAMFISVVVMSPVWTQVYNEAIVPYSAADSGMSLDEALEVGVQPMRDFMGNQIEFLENEEDIWLFYRYLPEGTALPESIDDVPLSALLPAFMISELKTAFLIGFQIYLPFLMLDILVASVTVSMGMFMLPPAYVSLPFKLLLFVMVDGWHLLVEMLLKSFVQ